MSSLRFFCGRLVFLRTSYPYDKINDLHCVICVVKLLSRADGITGPSISKELLFYLLLLTLLGFTEFEC